MRRRSFLHSAALPALAHLGVNAMTPEAFAAAAEHQLDPLLDEWTGSHGGWPRFDQVRVDAFKPAMMKGMDLKRVEIAAIASNRAAPNFENTFAALDNAGRPFRRATQIFRIYTSTMNDKRMQAVETQMAPVLSAFADEIFRTRLFSRLKAIYEAREPLRRANVSGNAIPVERGQARRLRKLPEPRALRARSREPSKRRRGAMWARGRRRGFRNLYRRL
jgi:peptidyl-dipeptidase Dcp